MSDEDFASRFVRVWETSDRLADAARKLGMTKDKCSQYANKLRRQSVKLKKMRVTGRKQMPTAAALNRLVAECRRSVTGAGHDKEPPAKQEDTNIDTEEDTKPCMRPEELIRWMLAQS